MKKVLMALGLILVLVGLIVTIWTASFQKEVVLYNYSWDSRRTWEISGDFSPGDRLTLEMTPGENWGMFAEPSYPGSEFPFDALLISGWIVDPKGGKTNFTVVFAQVEAGVGPWPGLQFFGAAPTSNDGGLSMEEEAIVAKSNETVYYNYLRHPSVMKNRLGGIANYNGTYKAVINKELPTEPIHLELFKQEIALEWPYQFVVPIGGTVIALGTALSVWAARKPRYRKRQKISKYK